ncbi:MAG: VanZ family protein [Pseudomonadota bacterium]
MARAPRSSAVPLALAFAALVAYASLYPFTDWRWPPGHALLQLMGLPWPAYFPRFDLFANLVGYLPLGALVCLAALRSGWSTVPALAVGVAGPGALSFGLEVLQNFLPARVPSRLDWGLNSAGAGLGASLAALLHGSGQLDRWQALRDRWFSGGSAGARALLLLWPVALLFPTPVPLALGQVAVALRELAEAALADTPWAAEASAWLAAAADVPPLSPLSEWLAILLGLLGPCWLAHSAMRPGSRRIVMSAGLAAVGFATTTLSTALNFGPANALTWMTPPTMPALLAGLVLAAATAWLGRRLMAALALVALTALVALVAQAPVDPYYAESLLAWQQGRFIRFHGLAQWVGWLWPYAAMGWLLLRLGARAGSE